MVGRDSGQVRLRVVKRTDAKTLQPFVEGATAPSATVNTDEWKAYGGLAKTGRMHATVCHTPGNREWVRDDDGDGVREVHRNTMEGIWTGLRNFLRPFRGVTKRDLSGYVAMFPMGPQPQARHRRLPPNPSRDEGDVGFVNGSRHPERDMSPPIQSSIPILALLFETFRLKIRVLSARPDSTATGFSEMAAKVAAMKIVKRFLRRGGPAAQEPFSLNGSVPDEVHQSHPVERSRPAMAVSRVDGIKSSPVQLVKKSGVKFGVEDGSAWRKLCGNVRSDPIAGRGRCGEHLRRPKTYFRSFTTNFVSSLRPDWPRRSPAKPSKRRH